MGEDVDEDFYPCKILADVGDNCHGEAGIGGVECCNVVCAEIQVFGKVDCALVVELLRNDDKAAYAVDFRGSYHRVEGAIAFAVENDVGRAYAVLDERIAHTHHFVHAVEAVFIAADENLAYLPGLVELFGSVDAECEEVVLFSANACLGCSAEQQAVFGRLNVFDFGKCLARGIVYNDKIADAHYQYAHSGGDSCRPQ